MSGVKEYLENLESLLNKITFKLSSKLQVENRGEAALYINGNIVFTDNSKLHFKEYFIAIPFLEKLAYSYHCQDKN